MRSFTGLLAAAALALLPSISAQEIVQSLISTGRIVNVSNTGALVLRSEQTGAPLLYYNVHLAPILWESGASATFADLRANQHATIYYALSGNRWIVAKILIADPTSAELPVPALTAAEWNALHSRAANDGDITTQPGVKARIDNDITTRPGFNDPAERDITKRPAR